LHPWMTETGMIGWTLTPRTIDAAPLTHRQEEEEDEEEECPPATVGAAGADAVRIIRLDIDDNTLYYTIQECNYVK
jgi:hypothetical protein